MCKAVKIQIGDSLAEKLKNDNVQLRTDMNATNKRLALPEETTELIRLYLNNFALDDTPSEPVETS